MIIGIGTDIIEVARMERQLSANQAFGNKLFTQAEIAYAEPKATRYQHYAARFAAKEAFFKALGTGYRFGMSFHEIEVVNDALGKPVIVVHGNVKAYVEKLEIKHMHLTLSHVKEMACAFVVLEK